MLAAIVLFVFFGISWWIYTRDEDNPLERLPGPPRKPFLGNTLEVMKFNAENFFESHLTYRRLYGDRYVIKMLGRWLLCISNADDVAIVLSHTKNIKKSTSYTYLTPWIGTGVVTSTGSKWFKRRKILTPTFHFNILKNFFLVMEEHSRNLVSTLNESRGKEVDVFPILSEYTLYTICETAMGTSLDTDQSSAAVDYKNATSKITHKILERQFRFWLRNDYVFKRTHMGKELAKNISTTDAFTENVISERRKRHAMRGSETDKLQENESKYRLALLDLLLEAERNGEIDIEGIREEVNTFMFGGHDTTAIALTFSLMLLADHEGIQEQVYEECQNLFDKCKGEPSSSDFSEMKYLEAVIKESLRLYPSVPMIGRQVDEDFMMRDLLVKKGTEVSVQLYSLHRSEDLYPEPNEFKPERFLNGEVKHPYGFLPFSAGPRNCIGQKYAMLEIKCFLYEIIRNFKLEPKVKGWRPKLVSSIVLKALESVYIRFIPRVK